MSAPSPFRQHIERRIAEAVREIGILLLAFSPLDMVFTSEAGLKLRAGLFFASLGLFLFGISLLMERKHVGS